MSKIEAFCLILDLKLIVAGSSDNKLLIFNLEQNEDTNELVCRSVNSKLKKESSARVIEIS